MITLAHSETAGKRAVVRVIGTAGHVDHGKSTLISALTGTHPDRLKEEQIREMTIELGFAWLTLPGGMEVGVVDVPGHRDFIENMLAGVGGIDAVLFVVAADEGVMPQTREHLAIVDLLQIRSGVVALTKADLIEDREWLDLVELDVHQVLQGTVLENAPILRVSARTGEGIEALKTQLAGILEGQPPRPNLQRPRLPIDRVFTISGFGTVLTGTLSDGNLRVGDEVEIFPSRLRGRVRGLQTHKKKEDIAQPGSRTAVNISGIDANQVERGNVLVKPGQYAPTQRLDTYFWLLPDSATSIHHNMEVKFFLAASELQGRVRLLGTEELLPGQEGWLQLELAAPVVAVRGDRYILRRPSPSETLGGGEVLDPLPKRRHKRFDQATLERLEMLRAGTPADVLGQVLQQAKIAPLFQVVEKAQLPCDQAEMALQELAAQERLVVLESGPLKSDADILVAVNTVWDSETQQAVRNIAQFHAAFPLKPGIGREELKSRLKAPSRVFNAALRRWLAEGQIVESGTTLRLPEFSVRFTPAQQAGITALVQKFKQSPFSPPSTKEAKEEVGEEVYNALVENKTLVAVSTEVVFLQETYQDMLSSVQARLQAEGSLTVAQFRDQFNTSRRYALAFLEHLDAIGVTSREGDLRRLKKIP